MSNGEEWHENFAFAITQTAFAITQTMVPNEQSL